MLEKKNINRWPYLVWKSLKYQEILSIIQFVILIKNLSSKDS